MLLLVFFKSHSQKLKFINVFDTLKCNIENNYVGYLTANTESVEYKNLVNSISEKTRDKNFDLNYYRALKEYLNFFNDPHLTFGFKFKNSTDSAFFKNDSAFVKLLKKSTRANSNLTLKEITFLSGEWIDDLSSKIYISKYDSKTLIGKVKTFDNKYWFENQIKFIIFKKNNKLYTFYETKDHFVRNSILKTNAKEITFGRFFKLFKKSNYFESIKDFKFNKFNNGFCYLRLPSCDPDSLDIVDSILKTNHNKIINTDNLIIDLRNNIGGSRQITNLLMPYVSNGEYIDFGSRQRNTPLIREAYRSFALSQEDTIIRKEYLDLFYKFSNNNEKYIYETNEKIVKVETTYKKPIKVYMLINEKTVSMAEIFTLSLKNSPKIITLGSNSAGATIFTDFKNVNIYNNFLKLNCPTFESNLLKIYNKRNLEVKPDIEINIPNEDWLKFILSL